MTPPLMPSLEEGTSGMSIQRIASLETAAITSPASQDAGGALGTIAEGISQLPVAESGTTTSEFRVLVGAAGADAIGLAIDMGAHVSPQLQQGILALVGALTTLAVSYIVGRSVRKHGSTT